MDRIRPVGRSRRRMLLSYGLLALLFLGLASCKGPLLTAIVLLRGTDVQPKHDFLLKGHHRVAVVARSLASNPYEIQNAPREIARELSKILDVHIQSKKVAIVDQSKIDDWLDNCNNDFDTFLEVGRDKKINATVVIGIEIFGFQIRDANSPYLVQGKCQLLVKAIDCETGETLASENLTIIDPPNMPISGGAGAEAAFRPQFIQVVAQQIGYLFHPHDPHKARRMDADNLEMHRQF